MGQSLSPNAPVAEFRRASNAPLKVAATCEQRWLERLMQPLVDLPASEWGGLVEFVELSKDAV